MRYFSHTSVPAKKYKTTSTKSQTKWLIYSKLTLLGGGNKSGLNENLFPLKSFHRAKKWK